MTPGNCNDGKKLIFIDLLKIWEKCCRDLGKAVERWRARLAVSQDAGRDQPAEQDSAGGGNEEQPQDTPGEDEDMPAGGEYEFVNAGEQQQAGV